MTKPSPDNKDPLDVLIVIGGFVVAGIILAGFIITLVSVLRWHGRTTGPILEESPLPSQPIAE